MSGIPLVEALTTGPASSTTIARVENALVHAEVRAALLELLSASVVEERNWKLIVKILAENSSCLTAAEVRSFSNILMLAILGDDENRRLAAVRALGLLNDPALAEHLPPIFDSSSTEDFFREL